jgi:hypothetical protein
MPWLIRRSAHRLAMDWLPYQRVRFFGTFGLSSLASLGAGTLSTWVPWTTMAHYTPFDEDGYMSLRTTMDHRVVDGVEMALAAREMEEVLNTTILDEVKQMRSKAA